MTLNSQLEKNSWNINIIERLKNLDNTQKDFYFAGFADGESCISVSFKTNASTDPNHPLKYN